MSFPTQQDLQIVGKRTTRHSVCRLEENCYAELPTLKRRNCGSGWSNWIYRCGILRRMERHRKIVTQLDAAGSNVGLDQNWVGQRAYTKSTSRSAMKVATMEREFFHRLGFVTFDTHLVHRLGVCTLCSWTATRQPACKSVSCDPHGAGITVYHSPGVFRKPRTSPLPSN